MTDIVYPLAYDSSGEYEDLRYSLRSLERYCKDIGRVYIVGCKPNWIKDVVHYAVDDTYQPWSNHIIKTKVLFEYMFNLKEYLLMNDDFYMTAPFTSKDYPLFNRGKITGIGQTDYSKILLKTKEFVEKERNVALHYGVHCPILYKADIYERVLDKIIGTGISKSEAIGYSFRCLYGNEIGGGIEVKDPKYYDKLVFEDNPCHCVSSGDNCDTGVLKEVFNEKSKWEC